MLLMFFVVVDGTNGPNEDRDKETTTTGQYVQQLDRTGFVNKGFIRRKSFIVGTTRESRAGKIG